MKERKSPRRGIFFQNFVLAPLRAKNSWIFGKVKFSLKFGGRGERGAEASAMMALNCACAVGRHCRVSFSRNYSDFSWLLMTVLLHFIPSVLSVLFIECGRISHRWISTENSAYPRRINISTPAAAESLVGGCCHEQRVNLTANITSSTFVRDFPSIERNFFQNRYFILYFGNLSFPLFTRCAKIARCVILRRRRGHLTLCVVLSYSNGIR